MGSGALRRWQRAANERWGLPGRNRTRRLGKEKLGPEAVCVKARLRLGLRWSKSRLVLRRSLVGIDRGQRKGIRGISNISRRAEGRLLGVDHGGWREMKGVLRICLSSLFLDTDEY